MKTKVIALDVYGTMLSTIGEGLPKRKGLSSLLKRLKEGRLTLCTCSDANTYNVKKDLSESGVDLKYFDKYFKMPRQQGDFTKQPKNFNPILKHYDLTPKELLIIGDRKERDIIPAQKLGCKAILVPEYYGKNDNNFNINNIKVF